MHPVPSRHFKDMNIPKLLAKAAGAALLPSALLFGTAESAHAIAVFFTPSGSQLDSDPISDLVVVPNTTQPFQFNLDLPLIGGLVDPFGTGTIINPGPPPALNTPFLGLDVTQFTYVLAFDASEWVPQQSSIDACIANTPPVPLPYSATCEVISQLGGAALPIGAPGTLVPGLGAIGSGVTNQFTFRLSATAGQGIIGGAPVLAAGGPLVGNVGNPLPNDGNADLLGTLLSITIGGITYDSNGVASSGPNLADGAQRAIFGSQSISLQPPSAVPGPLPLLGAGAAFGYSRRLRKRAKGISFKPVKA